MRKIMNAFFRTTRDGENGKRKQVKLTVSARSHPKRLMRESDSNKEYYLYERCTITL